MAEISLELANDINSLSPGHQVHQIGTRLRQALAGELPAGSVSTAELADLAVTEGKIGADAVTSAKIGAGQVQNSDIGANAVDLVKIAAGVLVGVSVDNEKTTSRDENIAGLASAILLCNSLKTVTNAHAADAATHATADTVNYPIVTDDCDDLSSLLALTGELLTAYDVHDDDSELGAAWAYHDAQETGNHTPTSVVTPTTLSEAITRLNDLKSTYNGHDADATTHASDSNTHQEATVDAAFGAAILVVDADVLAGDKIVFSILDSGTGTVVGVSAVAGAGGITFTFDADPQDDCIISYAVLRTAV